MASKPIEINETSFYQEVTQASKDATFVFKTNQTYRKFNKTEWGNVEVNFPEFMFSDKNTKLIGISCNLS